MVTLVQLEYVIAVDTYRHFATAAEKCFVTQPTLSMQLKKLEEELGIIIFDRSKQPVIPTDIGKAVIKQARSVLSEVRKLHDTIDFFQQKISGELKIGIIPTLAPYLLPRFIGDFVKTYPDLKVHIKELLTEEIVEYLHKDLIDVGILVTPLHEDGIIAKPMFYEGIQVYPHPEHRFANQSQVNMAEIADPEIWLLNEGHCFRNQVLNLCSYLNLQQHSLPIEYASGSLDTLIKLVDKEGGFTLLPELAVEDLPINKRVQVKTFIDSFPLREVSLVYARSFVKEKLIGILEQAIQQSIPEPMLSANRGTLVEWQ
ncbi:LysR substrate-binding domain-containing protein [Rapidithrix thailandica]|uniref:LysR substrate-binding domain-containing protein n=1 Tax=Rapidithrix thailandica TaxID=413964 RepID=A0AAW9S4U7_9BACT